MVFLIKNYIFIIFLLSLLLFQVNSSYIFLPFTKLQKSYKSNETNFTIEDLVEYYIEPSFSSIIEIGNPIQKVELVLSSERYGLSMIEDQNTTLNNTFNKILSSSIRVTDSFDSKFSYGNDRPVILNDTIYFSFYDSSLNKISKIKIEEYPFVYLTKKEGKKNYENKEFIKKEGKAYMIYGTKVYCNWKNEICESIPYYLKHLDITKSYNFNIVYNKNQNNYEKYDFGFLIGNELHKIYPDKYSEDNLIYTKALSYFGEINWIINFDEVFYFPEGFQINQNDKIDDLNQITKDSNLNDVKIHYSNDLKAQMAFDIDIILCPKFYYFSINKTFFSNHTDQCKINYVKKKYSIFVCDKNFNTENFPSIYFYHKELNHTFILTEKELFKIKGDKKYFLIIYDLYRPSFWMLGKIFLEKYSFNYDMENKRIGFYKNGISFYSEMNDNNNIINNKNILPLNIFWFIITLLVGIGGFFIGKKLFKKIRKKRANELDDNYDYEANIEKNENIYENYEQDSINKNERLNYNRIIN